MIEARISNQIDNFNARSADALGFYTPGYQPTFHDTLERKTRTVKSFDPLSVAAPEDTYFVVDNGDGSHAYSRGGDFRISQGQLVTRDGRAVLGYPNGVEKGTLAPITVPEGTPDGEVHITSDGTVRLGGGNFATSNNRAVGTDAPSVAVAEHSVPVTDASASEHLPAPTSAVIGRNVSPDAMVVAGNAKNLDVPNIALAGDTDSDVNVRMVALPRDAGHIDGSTVLGKSQNGAEHNVASRASDEAMATSLDNGLKMVGQQPAGIGTPLGKIALARFASGTMVSNDGHSTSGPPLEMGPPGSGEIEKLKTGVRDVGNVDGMAARVRVSQASVLMNAVLQIETARQSNAKKVMDLIK